MSMLTTSEFAKKLDWEQIARTLNVFILIYADNNFYGEKEFVGVKIKEPETLKTTKGNSVDSTLLIAHINCGKI